MVNRVYLGNTNWGPHEVKKTRTCGGTYVWADTDTRFGGEASSRTICSRCLEGGHLFLVGPKATGTRDVVDPPYPPTKDMCRETLEYRVFDKEHTGPHDLTGWYVKDGRIGEWARLEGISF